MPMPPRGLLRIISTVRYIVDFAFAFFLTRFETQLLILCRAADSVFEGDEDHDEIAQQWTQKYEEDNSEAMKDMVNFILKVSLACRQYIVMWLS